MHLSARDVAKSRQIARIVVRGLVLAIVCIFATVFLHEVYRKAWYGNFFGDWLHGDTVAMTPLLVVAGLLRFAERALIGWLAPLPKPECPACAYPITGVAGDRCPECGIMFGSAPTAQNDTPHP